MGRASKRRPVTGFRLPPDVATAFRAALKARSIARQQTLESWVRLWLAETTSDPEEVLISIKRDQLELRGLLDALVARYGAQPASRPAFATQGVAELQQEGAKTNLVSVGE